MGVVILAVVTLMQGGSIGDVFSNVLGSQVQMAGNDGYTPDAEDQRLYDLASKVLAGTEDVWTDEFRKNGWGEYEPPRMVVYTGSVQSGCGQASSQVGPFYCSADQTVYIDLDFFRNMESTLGAGGDFTYAYVIAHEVGHHVQYLLGTLDQSHALMNRLSQAEANRVSVRLELQADFYAGVWANRDNAMFGSIEEGDVEKALNAASKIGDDYLQRRSTGTVQPETFNHGRSDQRVKWFSRGLQTGDATLGDTFTPQYSSL